MSGPNKHAIFRIQSCKEHLQSLQFTVSRAGSDRPSVVGKRFFQNHGPGFPARGQGRDDGIVKARYELGSVPSFAQTQTQGPMVYRVLRHDHHSVAFEIETVRLFRHVIGAVDLALSAPPVDDVLDSGV